MHIPLLFVTMCYTVGSSQSDSTFLTEDVATELIEELRGASSPRRRLLRSKKKDDDGDDDGENNDNDNDDGFRDDDKIYVDTSADVKFYRNMKVYHDTDRFYHSNGEQQFLTDQQHSNGPKVVRLILISFHWGVFVL
jgi:hypothetical protein